MKRAFIFIHYLVRLLFCLSLVILSYKNLHSNQMRKKTFINNFDKINHSLRKYVQLPYGKFIKANADAFVLLPIYLLILTSVLSLLNLPMSKSFALLSVLLHIFFIDNCLWDPERKSVLNASVYLGLYGALIAY